MVSSFRLIFFLLLISSVSVLLTRADDWRIEDETFAQDPASPFVHERKLVRKVVGERAEAPRRVDLIWFRSSTHTFRVLDNGPDARRYTGIADAMRKNAVSLGCNGGFFHPDYSPSGLMITSRQAIGHFGEGALLSGVILSSGRGNPYLLRRGEYAAEKYLATDLIQSGPFLVDQWITVKGLSPESSRRRTFVLHDGQEWLALGLSESFTLAELGDVLARTELSPSRRIFRALNLDGGSSSGLYFERGTLGGPLVIEPSKSVRNFIAIIPKSADQ